MKANRFLSFILVILSSCSVPEFYQVYKVSGDEKIGKTNNELVFEDANCKLTYNLWSAGGSMGFWFYNKTDKPLFIHMNESYFVMNGVANNYYKGRTYTDSKTIGISTGKSSRLNISSAQSGMFGTVIFSGFQAITTKGESTSSGSAVSYMEEEIVCIPSKTSKYIYEYKINSNLYRDCDLFRYPLKKQINTKSFTTLNSPYIFSNRIVYSIGETQSSTHQQIENNFFVSEITNYPSRQITVMVRDEFCGQRSYQSHLELKDKGPDKFYIRYSQTDSWKH